MTKSKQSCPVTLQELVDSNIKPHRYPDMLYTGEQVTDFQKIAYIAGIKDFRKTVDWRRMKREMKKHLGGLIGNKQALELINNEAMVFVERYISEMHRLSSQTKETNDVPAIQSPSGS